MLVGVDELEAGNKSSFFASREHVSAQRSSRSHVPQRHITRRAPTHALAHHAPPGTESVDFDLHESPQFVKHAQQLGLRDRKMKGLIRWCIMSVIGMCTGLVGVGVDKGVEYAFELREWIVEHVHENELGLIVDYLAYLVPCVILASVAGMLVCYVEPLAAGSGIPEVKCYLNGVHLPRIVDFKTLFAKAVGIMFSVSAGMPCGKEGPMIHSGAALGGVLSRAGVVPLLKPYRALVEHRDFVTAGAASGVAAAFGAPLGGVLFAMEEGATYFTPAIMLRTFVCCTTATLTVRFFLTGFHGHYDWGTMGAAAPLSFGNFARSNWQIYELLIFALMGAMGGLMGAAFNATNTRLTLVRKMFIPSRGHLRFIEVIITTFLITSVMFWVPVLTSGSADPKKFNPTEALFRKSGVSNIDNLFHNPEDFDNMLLLLFGVLYYMLACYIYGLGLPSGLFVPSLLSGAALGRLVGQLLKDPLDLRYDNLGKSDPGVYALMGATALLSGMARITISLAVIVMEASGTVQWALPIFVTTMCSKWVGDFFTIGLYDIHIELNHVPLLEAHPCKDMLMLQAKNVMTKMIVTFDEVETVRRLVFVLQNSHHHGYIVTTDKGTFKGLIKRENIEQVLWRARAHDVFQEKGQVAKEPPMVPYEDESAKPTLEEIRRMLRPDDYDKVIDLRPYVNDGCFTVPPHAALLRVHMLFRGMGLRHLPVVTRDGKAQGIITRKDLILASEEPFAEKEREKEKQKELDHRPTDIITSRTEEV